VVVGAGCGGTTPPAPPASPVSPAPPPIAVDAAAPRAIAQAWHVWKHPDGTCDGLTGPCTAVRHRRGEPAPPCNPPSAKMWCPTPMTGDELEVVSYDGTSCVVMGTDAPIECPAEFVPRTWEIEDDGKGCYAHRVLDCYPANDEACRRLANAASCPPFHRGDSVVETAPDKCAIMTRIVPPPAQCPPHATCNPPPPRTIEVEVPCPH
jgi:hypothetical protein